MGKLVIVMSCAHTRPEVDNDRFIALGKFLYDMRPDEFINLGDFSEMNSLSSYDSGKPTVLAERSYEKDVICTLDAHEKMWHQYRKNKVGMPFRMFLQGNHEYRIDKYRQANPNMGGNIYGVSIKALAINDHYHEYHPYAGSGPAIVVRDGVAYAHFVASGSYGRAIGGVNHARSLLEKTGCSTTVGHSHRLDYSEKRETISRPMIGLTVGCFMGANQEWAGQANAEWAKGVVVKHQLENGLYDFSWVSLDSITKAYPKT